MQQSDTPRTNVIHIKMLGGFCLSDGEHSVSDSINRAKRLWSFIEYLVVFRNRDITQNDLVLALWQGAECESPSEALKNLVYRLRIIFEQHSLAGAKDIIVFTNGCYRLNPCMEFDVDIEKFEQQALLGRDPSLLNIKRFDYYTKALELHDGEFLPSAINHVWSVPTREKIKRLYLECIYFNCMFLGHNRRYTEMYELCCKAAALYPFEERVQKHLIYALSKAGMFNEALERYRYVTDMFYREIGVKPSDSMRQLYVEIIKALSPEESDLPSIKSQLDENVNIQSAYYCEYEVFKNLYRIQARSKERTGLSVFIALVTAVIDNGFELENQRLGVLMDSVLQSASSSLRCGDVISRYSRTQYILMLSALTYENGMAVLGRIKKRFSLDRRFHFAMLKCELQPIEVSTSKKPSLNNIRSLREG